MLRTTAILGARFFVAAALYITVALIWLQQVTGNWKGLAFLALGILLGIAAVASWAAAVAIGHYNIVSRWLRLLVHPALATILFVAVCFFIVDTRSESPEFTWRDVVPFIGLVAAITAADALVGLLLEWLAPPRPIGTA